MDTFRTFRKLIFCIADQVLFSATHFLISLYFGRVLTPSQYGAFSIVYATFLLVLTIHYGLVLEPMIVLGSTRYEDLSRRYIRSVLIANSGLGVIFGFLAALVLAISQAFNREVITAALYFGASCPFLLTAYVLRRACYVLDQPSKALVASGIYLVVSVITIAAISTMQRLETASVFVALSIGAVVSSFIMWKLLRLQSHLRPGTALLKDAIVEHWRYGRWATGCLFLNWMFLALYYPVLGRAAGLESAATLRAFDNFTLPIPQLLTALSILFLPRIARLITAENQRAALKLAMRLTMAAVGLCGLYFGPLCFLGADVARLVYPHRPYSQSVWLLPWICLVITLKSISDFGMGLFLRASNRPDLSFNILRVGAILTLVCSLIFCATWGIAGAVFGRVTAVVGEIFFGVWYMSRLSEKELRPSGQLDRIREPNSVVSWQEQGGL